MSATSEKFVLTMAAGVVLAVRAVSSGPFGHSDSRRGLVDQQAQSARQTAALRALNIGLGDSRKIALQFDIQIVLQRERDRVRQRKIDQPGPHQIENAL